MRSLILIFFVWSASIALPLSAQQTDTLPPAPVVIPFSAIDSTGTPNDTTRIEKHGFVRRFFSKNYPDPKKAALLGVIPGLGQAYNKKFWKIPIVYAAIGGMLYWEIDNLKTYRDLRDNYKAYVDENPATVVDPKFKTLDAASLKKYRDQFRRYSEQTSLALGLVYLLSVTDAFVDAHLSRFDVSDDLSMRVLPRTQTALGFGPAFGIGVQFQIRPKHTATPHSFLFSPQLSPPVP